MKLQCLQKKQERASRYGRVSTYKPFCTSVVPIEKEFNKMLIKIPNSIKPDRHFTKNKIYAKKYIFVNYVFGNHPMDEQM